MHVARSTGLGPALAIVLPHPQLPRSRSSLASDSPRTPRTPSCGSPIFFAATNRNSTSSWNSSNGPDDEYEWKPEQVRLLARTLDALPAHLVTPFNGPIPPSNLLDKIARGVSEAKGPIDWPHSIRATRVKLIELSRIRAKEEQAQQIIAEVYTDAEMDGADDAYACYPEPTGKNFGVRRPLYRQSSMDFMNAADLKENDNITCLSDRLQRTDRLIPNAAYHPYSRGASRVYQRRLSSPTRPGNTSSLASPSTPSSSTLNTLSSVSTHHSRILRRTASNLSSASSISMMSSNSGGALPDPRVQRVKRSESFCAPPPPPKDIKVVPSLKAAPPVAGIKRAPSFGALAQDVKRDRHIFGGALKGPAIEREKELPSYPSSDEEEKIRSKGAKKMRVKDIGGLVPIAGTPVLEKTTPSSPKRTKSKVTTSPKSPTPKPKTKLRVDTETPPDPSAKSAKKTRPVPPMNLQRNPSIFGEELPHLAGVKATSPISRRGSAARPETSPSPRVVPAKTTVCANASPVSPADSPQKARTLRRVRRLAPARRISFGSLIAPGEDADGEAEEDEGRSDRQRQRDLGQLGSAFQLS